MDKSSSEGGADPLSTKPIPHSRPKNTRRRMISNSCWVLSFETMTEWLLVPESLLHTLHLVIGVMNELHMCFTEYAGKTHTTLKKEDNLEQTIYTRLAVLNSNDSQDVNIY